MQKNVLIVGAGPGGLASAILLASAGLGVRVIERLPFVGGRTSTHEAQGFKFDLGPTFFLYPRILDEILQTAGTSLAQEIPMIRLDPQYRLLFGAGGIIDATPDIARLESEVARIAPQDAPQLRPFLAENRAKLEAFKPCLESPFANWRDLINPRMLGLMPMLRPHLSLDRYLRRYFSDPRIRLAFSFQSKYLGMSPFRCPSLFSILSFLEYEHGVFHPIGGCGAVCTGLARVAERLGVEIRLNEPVEEILFDGRRAIGARTASGRYEADAVVVNADFAHAIPKLIPNALRRRWTDRKIESKQFSCSTYMIYLGIKGRYDLPHHTIYISADYERNLDEIENQHVLSADPSCYVQNASVTDDTLAPPGHSSVYILAPVSHQHPNIDWEKERGAFRQRMLRQIEKLGYTNIESRIVYERVLTPANWEHGYAIYRGATFNLAHSLNQMLLWRPHNRFEDVDGLYLVGGGTHPGSGLPVIFESARISSRLLLEDLGVPAPQAQPLATPATAAGFD
jgi:phytoene desaturase